MRRPLALAAVLAGLALATPAGALAAEQTFSFTSPAILVEGHGVARVALPVESPPVDGYVVGMTAEIVDGAGNVQGPSEVMLHHVVFAKLGPADATCGGSVQRFYALGEERTRFWLPAGFGYASRATEDWAMLGMLMNHRPERLTGYVRYTVRFVTGEELTPVTPVWLDVRNCVGLDPIFDVPGGGKRFSTYTRTADFTLPESGVLVAGGAHLHGGGIRAELRNVTCGTAPFTSLPTWGGPRPLPLLHEPGPTRMSQFTSAEGIPVASGQTLRLRAVYENELPHTRAMGIMILYLAPRPVTGCGRAGALDVDLGSPSAPPPFSMPLPRAPQGPLARWLPGTWVGDFRYRNERVLLRRGATFSWSFVGASEHDVTVVGGPVGFSSPWTLRGTFRHRFTKPGTYRLFCSLHPTRMSQVVTVR